MRLLLDVHISAIKVGSALEKEGHDVLSASTNQYLARLSDPELFEFATKLERIIVTFDVKDFPQILTDRASENKAHSGCILVAGIRNNEHGILLKRLRYLLSKQPNQSDWHNLAMWLPRNAKL